MGKLLPKQEELGSYMKHLVEGSDFNEPNYLHWGFQSRIVKWNVNRRLTHFDAKSSKDIFDSEGREYDKGLEENDVNEMLDGLCDMIVVEGGFLAQSGHNNKPLNKELQKRYDFCRDIPVIVERLGYDFLKCMDETLKEIESRQQCPAQKARWESGDYTKGEKWQKDKNQDPETLYKANYEACKLPEEFRTIEDEKAPIDIEEKVEVENA